jgi:DNA-binding NarL/FixJ family response regulator
MAAIRVLLVDDESLVRQALRGILATHEDIDVVGEAASGDEAVSSVERLHPHVVILDIRMPRMDGVAAAREIRYRFPHVKMIGLSELTHGHDFHAMQRAGVLGIYQKSKATEELYPAIKQAVAA